MSLSKSCPNCGQLVESLTDVGVCETCLASEATRRSLADQGYDVDIPTSTFHADSSVHTPDLSFDYDVPTRDAPFEPLPPTTSISADELNVLSQRKLIPIRDLYGGGMGNLYLAEEESTRRRVVVKFVRQVHRGDARIRFVREVQALADLNHPAIVQLFYPEVDVETPYFVMEWMEGGGLDNLVKNAKKSGEFLPVNVAVRYLESVARGIHYAHEHQITHRDLKPSNVLLTRNANGETIAKVADFGLARRLDDEVTLTAEGGIVGTPGYMAPEQALGESCDARTDIYGLGATLYSTLCARAPFGTHLSDIPAIVRGSLTPPRALRPDLPYDLEAVCLKALERDPRNRYASAKEFADDLQRFLQDIPTRARPRSWAMRQWHFARQIPRVVAFASFIVMLTLAFSFILLSNNRAQSQVEKPPAAALPTPLETMEATLNLGNPYQAVGETGLPKWLHWEFGATALGSYQPGDEYCTFESVDYGLLSVCPDPLTNHDRIRFEALRRELAVTDTRPNPKNKSGSGYGIFFGHQLELHSSGHGFQTYLRLVIHDLDLEVKRGCRAWLEEAGIWTRPAESRGTISKTIEAQVEFDRSTHTSGKWRKFEVEVHDRHIKGYWINDQGEKVVIIETRLPPGHLAFLNDADEFLQPQGFQEAQWNPRGRIGLYCHRAVASFRNVWIEPIP